MDLSVRNRELGTVWNKSQSVSTSGTNAFLEAANVIRKKKISPAPDVSEENLAVGSYEQRLARLKKLHAETDYSGMEPCDRDKLIKDRFKAAFPDFMAIWGGLYNIMGEYSIYNRIHAEAIEESEEALGDYHLPRQHDDYNAYLRYVWGYDGMTEDEIRAAVLEKYSGGTLADRLSAVTELDAMNIDRQACALLSTQFNIEMRKGTEREYGHLHTDNPIRINAMIAYAKGNQISWQGLCNGLMEEMQTHTFKSIDMSPEEAKRLYLAEMEDCLMDFLERLEHAERNMKESYTYGYEGKAVMQVYNSAANTAYYLYPECVMKATL